VTRVTLAQLLWFVFLAPPVGAALCLGPRQARTVMLALVALVLATGLAGTLAALAVLRGGPLALANGWLRLDALSAVHLLVLDFVFVTSTLFAPGYFAGAELTVRRLRLFASLWLLSFGAMTLVLLANHLGILWVGVETTTLVTTFLIAFHRSRESLEATWKYLMICSVGIAIAFLGMLILGAAASRVAGPGTDAVLWTTLREVGGRLDPRLAKLGFVFLLVGYGTKVGLAPMHTWLPDAHSQAPAPVSSVFSAAMLSTVMYCLMRYLPVLDAVAPGFAGRLLCLFGALSMIIAAAFILFGRDVKRMLAYCSVEHMGIVAIGLGLGGAGAFAAMFHTVNHALAKSAGFLCAGRLGQTVGSNQIRHLQGSLRRSPFWGAGLAGSLFALIGMVPSAIFVSELMIVRAAVAARATLTLIAFLVAAGTVFLGMFGHTMTMMRGQAGEGARPARAGLVDWLVIGLPLLALAVLGLWLPEPVRDALAQAAALVRPAP
jgi:hydrogenase-4 component F